MSEAEQALATLRDYVERSTHWQEGGADRHAALLALQVLEEERCLVCGHLAEACGAAHSDDEDGPRRVRPNAELTGRPG